MNGKIACLISFILALLLSALILLFPQVVIDSDNKANHALLMLYLVGIMLGFMHGVGFHAKTKIGQTLLGPLCSWPIMAGGLLLGLITANII